MGISFTLLALACVLRLSLAVYVQQSTSGPDGHHVIACPQGCQCFHDDMTATCAFKSSASYKLDTFSPWKLLELSIHSNTLSGSDDSSLYDLLFKRVSVTDNNVKRIFSKLQTLEVKNIPLKKISENDLVHFPNLKELTLSGNKIKYIEPKAFRWLGSLLQLNLDGNELAELPQELFQGLNSLKSLKLNKNSLRNLQSSSFNGLHNLETLNVNSNMLQQVENFLLGLNISSLRSLDMSNNLLSYITNDSSYLLSNFASVDISRNKFQCTCALQTLIEVYHRNQTVFKGETTCAGPAEVMGFKFRDLNVSTLPCRGATVESISQHAEVLYQSDFSLDCQVSGDLPRVVYWITPWGDMFTHDSSKVMFPGKYDHMVSNAVYSKLNVILTSEVFIDSNNSLHIHAFRGYFSGEHICVAENLVGSSNMSVSLAIRLELKAVYISSVFIGAYTSGAILGLGTIIGLLRLFVHKYCHSQGCNCCCCSHDELDVVSKHKTDNGDIEVTYAHNESIGYIDDDEDESPSPSDPGSPPEVPVNSPNVRGSPSKCQTPGETEEQGKGSQDIWSQLDEVRSRLKYGAGKKIEKVRSHVRSITDTGSLKIREIKDAGSMKIQSIKETSSHAAHVARKTVVSGMEQVKYSVQSMKEFCGTGDMGPGTISMVSVSTDVDTTETVKIVRSHTFV
ncbi:leucine-rich repeat and immunoglobulin-like domain-containing nogo receptor-interacting protein 1 [Dreissena polymorpha]|uniref:Ig-like domain-containing protein n=1 Tax=Dreissena polymorpha TaxID=45954 RepID=A0A9D4GS11_DREPO|nr:leucine-rich repeat and immunoglobulin-like domain-containing nogo receptor-interacting protein 1 [Dreissena polymorpha]XP_052286214.1 leucine-rich repeat and immunoglobulin-like domain-containing nogo receptor-interacting protein 1 [Dreissena polymorpha]KAH3822586.1 hypothetical protein DPMN_124370 [Dreissena polymorpha]